MTVAAFLITVVIAGAAAVFGGQHETRDHSGHISYGRQIAPIFALHCSGCHSESNPSSGFQVSTYKGLLAGGVFGQDIVPGFPDRSALVHFIEGFRGPDQRMPLGSRPLSSQQIWLIRRWIAQGAIDDNAATPCYTLRLPACTIAPGHPLRIGCKVSTAADLLLLLRGKNNRILYREEASIKDPPEQMNAGAPGQLLRWTLNYEKTWEPQVSVELVIRYTAADVHAMLKVDGANGFASATRRLDASFCAPD